MHNTRLTMQTIDLNSVSGLNFINARRTSASFTTSHANFLSSRGDLYRRWRSPRVSAHLPSMPALPALSRYRFWLTFSWWYVFFLGVCLCKYSVCDTFNLFVHPLLVTTIYRRTVKLRCQTLLCFQKWSLFCIALLSRARKERFHKCDGILLL